VVDRPGAGKHPNHFFLMPGSVNFLMKHIPTKDTKSKKIKEIVKTVIDESSMVKVAV